MPALPPTQPAARRGRAIVAATGVVSGLALCGVIAWALLGSPASGPHEDALARGRAGASPAVAPGPVQPAVGTTPRAARTGATESALDEGAAGARELAAVSTDGSDEELLRGVVVDSSGAPLAGIRVGLVFDSLRSREGSLNQIESSRIRAPNGYDTAFPIAELGLLAEGEEPVLTDANGRFELPLSDADLEAKPLLVATEREATSVLALAGGGITTDLDAQARLTLRAPTGYLTYNSAPLTSRAHLTVVMQRPAKLTINLALPPGLPVGTSALVTLERDGRGVEWVRMKDFHAQPEHVFARLLPGPYSLIVEVGCKRWEVQRQDFTLVEGDARELAPIEVAPALDLFRLRIVNEYGKPPAPEVLRLLDTSTGLSVCGLPRLTNDGLLEFVVPAGSGPYHLKSYTQGEAVLSPSLAVPATHAATARRVEVTLYL